MKYIEMTVVRKEYAVLLVKSPDDVECDETLHWEYEESISAAVANDNGLVWDRDDEGVEAESARVITPEEIAQKYGDSLESIPLIARG